MIDKKPEVIQILTDEIETLEHLRGDLIFLRDTTTIGCNKEEFDYAIKAVERIIKTNRTGINIKKNFPTWFGKQGAK